MKDLAGINQRFMALRDVLDERSRRLVAASEALMIGRGGISAVSQATGMARQVLRRGMAELNEPAVHPPGRIRRPGGGRRKAVAKDPTLLRDLERLVEPVTRGDPESPLRWTCKSIRRLAAELQQMGHPTSHRMVAGMLRELGYSLQANRKTKEGTNHPDRNAQFEYLNRKVQRRLAAREPVISVDTKKKELVVGTKANKGREWQPKGSPERVDVHDFPDPEVPKAVPYGIYDLAQNEGFVSVGDSHDTAEFAVETIRRWWAEVGSLAYPDAERLLITADAGGSNSYRSRLWRLELSKLAAEAGIDITVCHFPPGTSKWNKIVLYTGFPGVYEVTNEAV